MDSGALNVGGLTTVTINNSRYSILDIAGGTFNGSGGVQLGGIYGNPDAELIVRGTAVVNTPSIVFGDQAQTSDTDLLDLFGGTTYIGAGGMTTNFNTGTSTAVATVNLGGTAYATAPVLAASAPWTTTENMTVTNSSSGLLATIKTANASGGAVNITLNGNMAGTGGIIKAGAGVLTLSGTNTYTGTTNVSAGTLVLTQAASLAVAGTPLQVSSGALVVANNVGASFGVTVNNINNTGVINLNNNLLVINGTTNTLAAISTQVAAGFNGGKWNGATGITSGTAAADTTHLTALGTIVNDNGSGSPLYGSGGSIAATLYGTTPADGNLLIKYTYYGDANLDGIVDGTDYSRIDNAFLNNQNSSNAALTGWYNGDFNYDGVINGSDYTLIDNAFNTQGASLAAIVASPIAQLAGGGAPSVPEPASLGLLGIGAIGLLGRRHRAGSR
jgi:autotransporter-associated beta strand protein